MTGLVAAVIVLLAAAACCVPPLLRAWRNHRHADGLPVLSESDCRSYCYQGRPGRPMVRRVQRDGRPRRWRRRLTVLDVLVPARQQPAAAEEHSVDQEDAAE